MEQGYDEDEVRVYKLKRMYKYFSYSIFCNYSIPLYGILIVLKTSLSFHSLISSFTDVSTMIIISSLYSVYNYFTHLCLQITWDR